MFSIRKRSARVIMTNEARVLKALRIEAQLSMRQAGALLGKSDSYIAHIETGRMDAPSGAKLDQFLGAYGGMKQKSFYERVRKHAVSKTVKEELFELVDRGRDEHLSTLLLIAKALIS